jgi:NhaA family Na+:H+ antiporter
VEDESIGSPSTTRNLRPLRDFLATESGSGVLLAASAVTALAWANSPWSRSYVDLWSSSASVSVAGHTLELDLQHWINDGLMAIFFLVVGLEIKRELASGHLSTRKAALLPVAAAFGGMVMPALIYLAIAGGTAAQGWAIPMATDIALAVGVVAVAGSRVKPSLRVFLLGLAIVDDIGAIIIIAVFYTDDVTWSWLATAAAVLFATAAAHRMGVRRATVFVVLGVALWLSLHEAGVHATLAGVALGLLAPSRPHLTPEFIDADELADVSSVKAAQATTEIARASVSDVEWLQHVLHPWTSYLIVPLFALANTGIEISSTGLGDAARSPITWAIIAGLVIGKPLGIIVSSRLAVRAGIAAAPEGAAGRQMLGIGSAAGIGFTVALFITELAFDDPARQADAKLAVLVASVMAAAIAAVLLLTENPAPENAAPENAAKGDAPRSTPLR